MTTEYLHKRGVFTKDPFPIRDEESESSAPSKARRKDDVVVLRQGQVDYELNRTTLRETLQELRTVATVAIEKLSTAHTVMFTSVVDALRLLHSDHHNYNLVYGDVQAVFADVKSPPGGSVAAFLAGCFADDKFTGPRGCSAKCAAGLPLGEDTPAYNSCDDLILHLSNGELSSINSKQSEHAYVYVDDRFTGFSTLHIKQLQEGGVARVSIVHADKNGTYEKMTPTTSLDKLPLQKHSYMTMVILFILLLVALCVFYFLRRGWTSTKQEETGELGRQWDW